MTRVILTGAALVLGLGLLVSGCSSGGSSSGPPPPPASPPPGGTTSGGTVTLTTVDPTTGDPAGGDVIALAGTGFSSTSTVSFGGTGATVLAYSSTILVVASPPGSGTTTITVTTGSDYATIPFTFNLGTGTDTFRFKVGTEKWWIDVEYAPEADADGNGFGDLSEALATLKNSTGGTGFNDFQGAVGYLFQFVSQFYHNNPDGTLASGGVPVSFRRSVPAFGNVAPAGLAIVPVSALDHNLMALRNVAFIAAGEEQTGVAGRSSSETLKNDTLENNSGGTTPGGGSDPPLGTFVDAAAYFWNASAIPNSRRTLPEFMEEVAQITAHEMGHSMGLLHTNAPPPPPATVNMMSASIAFDPTNIYDFDTTSYTNFLGWMPGQFRLVHRSALAPRKLVAASDVVVQATPGAFTDGVLELTVERVLMGSVETGTSLRVVGLPPTTDPQALAQGGPFVFFLNRDSRGQVVAGEASCAMSLAGRDPAEWRDLIADYVALRGLEADPAAWRAAYVQRLTTSLRSADDRIREDALVELSVQRGVVRSLDATALDLLQGLVADGTRSPKERTLAACAFVHRAEGAQAARLLEAALTTDEPPLLETLAGALEESLGLSQAAAAVRQRVADVTDAAQLRRARVLLGWLLDAGSVPAIAQDLARPGADAWRAADALGRIGEVSALPALQALADDEARARDDRCHALRAIGRIGTPEARDWLSARQEAWSGDMAEAARFARDYPEGWRIQGR